MSENPLSVIVAQSTRQAMDWSLVLLSQGIEPEVHHALEGRGVEVRVPAADLARAEEIIALYRRENRHRRWRQTVVRAGLVYDWQCLGWGLLVVVFYALSVMDGARLRLGGEFSSVAFQGGEWWRALTAIWLHFDLRHLASNLCTGLIFLGVAMAQYGAGPALLAVTLAGGLANWAGFLFHARAYVGLGASGAVMAALGLIAVRAFRFREWRDHPGLTTIRGFVAGGFLLILFGFNPESDVLVHVAGFILGATFGLFLRPLAEEPRRQLDWDLPCKTVFLGLVTGAWWKALQ